MPLHFSAGPCHCASRDVAPSTSSSPHTVSIPPTDASLHIRYQNKMLLWTLPTFLNHPCSCLQSIPSISGPWSLAASARGTAPKLRITMFVQKHYQMKEAAAKKQTEEKKKAEQAAPKQEQAKK